MGSIFLDEMIAGFGIFTHKTVNELSNIFVIPNKYPQEIAFIPVHGCVT